MMTIPPALAVAVASSDLVPEIPLGFGGQEAMDNAVRYTKIAFVVFDRGHLLFLLGLSSLSLSTGAGTDKKGGPGGGAMIPGTVCGSQGRKI